MEAISSTNTQAIMAKKAWKMAVLLLKKAFSNTNLLLKRGNKLAAKALEYYYSLLLKHAFFICSSPNDVVRSFPAATFKEYEFSCSDSPAFPTIPGMLRRRRHIDRRRCRYRVDEAAVSAAVQRVFDMLNTGDAADGAGSAAATPMVLPGFGKSPAVPVRQLRVTDSPFPVKENEEESKQVSKAAEEFIRNFYGALKREKSFESPYRRSHYQ